MVKHFPADMEISNRSLHEVAYDSLRLKSDRIAVVDGRSGRSLTYGELEGGIRRASSGLRRLGVTKGDVVVIFSPNSIEYAHAVLAIVSNGAVSALVNPSHTAYELEHALNLTKPSWIITVPSLMGKLHAVSASAASTIKATIVIDEGSGSEEGIRGIGFLVSFEGLLRDDGSRYPSSLQIDSAKDAAIIMFSSGTTGAPKGVMLSHYNIVATLSMIDFLSRRSPPIHKPDEQPVLMLFLPLCHTTGLLMSLMRGLMSNQKIIILPRFNLEQVLHCVEKYKVTVLPLVPSVLLMLAKSPSAAKRLSSVRRVFVGAAPLSAATSKEFMDATGCSDLRQGFGMTELTLTAMNSSSVAKIKPGSVGVPLPNTEVLVADPDSGQVLGPNQRGEIWVRGPQVMMGYINNPEATKAAIDSSGFLHTGDIGYYDDEGFFYIVDRIKELIKYKGFQVAPAELESLILTNPGVADVAVVGVLDNEAGELPRAFVVRKRGSEVSADDIERMVAERLSSYKHLRGGVEFVEEIPKTETGKILRRVLRQKDQWQKARSRL